MSRCDSVFPCIGRFASPNRPIDEDGPACETCQDRGFGLVYVQGVEEEVEVPCTRWCEARSVWQAEIAARFRRTRGNQK